MGPRDHETLDAATARARAAALLERAHVVVTPRELEQMQVVDGHLGMLERIGLQIIVYVNTARVCAKELVLLPFQTCPEHRHPPVGDESGKEETFRCRWGEVYLYIPAPEGELPAGAEIHARLPPGKEATFTARHEVHLLPGQQFTLPPDTLHWFQAGPAGAVISEFSTMSRDALDVFTDPAFRR